MDNISYAALAGIHAIKAFLRFNDFILDFSVYL